MFNNIRYTDQFTTDYTTAVYNLGCAGCQRHCARHSVQWSVWMIIIIHSQCSLKSLKHANYHIHLGTWHIRIVTQIQIALQLNMWLFICDESNQLRDRERRIGNQEAHPKRSRKEPRSQRLSKREKGRCIRGRWTGRVVSLRNTYIGAIWMETIALARCTTHTHSSNYNKTINISIVRFY